MLKIISTLMPMFMVIALGYVLAASRFINAEHLQGFGRLVIAVALPMMIFKTLSSYSLSEIFIAPYLFGYSAATLCVFALSAGFALWRRQTTVGALVDGMASAYSNSVFVGYPLGLAVLGSGPAGIYLSLNVLIEMMLLVPLFLSLMEYVQAAQVGGKPKLFHMFINILKKPLILALLLGLLFSACRWQLPLPVFKAIEILADAASPLALLIIGGSLYGLRLQGSVPDIIQITAVKILLMPPACAGFVALFGGSREMIFAGALLGGLPLANAGAILCQQYGHMNRGTASMLLSTIFSTLTLSLIFMFYNT
ncbi:AEC family transporter [Suttonella indologenes]|uniref:Putative transporter YfdV n=1 Tax=Suttonella indologenes TaxID=13276 RepID=A0A380MK14_9GAMM|nr:AEC family transporter [Suttonella indologenes]SUO91330.1 putative transporter YfdV [Suttonella indologenes]